MQRPVNFFIEGGASGRILNPNGHPITIFRTADGEAQITVGGGESDDPADFG